MRAAVYARSPRTEKSIGDVGDAAIVVVGNALVDAPYRPSQKEELGDYPEIAIVTPRQTWFVRYTPGQGFYDLTASSKLADAKGDAARWADLDHDGDIDLCLTSSGKLSVWRNNGDGSFVEATKDFNLSDVAASADFAAVDLDGVNLGVDLVLAGPGGSTLERNQYGGRFAQDKDAAASWPPAERILADDFNNDGLPDFVFVVAEARDDRPRRRHRSTKDHDGPRHGRCSLRRSTSTTMAGSTS